VLYCSYAWRHPRLVSLLRSKIIRIKALLLLHRFKTNPCPFLRQAIKALSYYHSGNILWFVEILWGMLIPALFCSPVFPQRSATGLKKSEKKWFFVVGIYFIIFTIISTLIDLPLSYYTGIYPAACVRSFEPDIRKWAGDTLKSLMVGSVFGFCIVWIPYWLLKKAPKRWWLYVGLGTVLLCSSSCW